MYSVQDEESGQLKKQDVRTQLQKKYDMKNSQVQPLSYNQRAMWLVQQIEPGNVSYNIAITLHIASAIDIPAMRAALQAVVDRHATFRTVYDSVAGEPFQIVCERQEVDFETIDATNWSEAELAQSLHANLTQAFDLANDRMLRTRLYVRDVDKFTLQIMTHHISADGWSAWILIRDLQQGYAASQKNEPISLPTLPCQYSDFVEWQSDMLAAKGEELWSFWREELSGGLTALNILTDFNLTEKRPFAGASHQFILDQEITGKLRELAHAEGATLYRILLAAFQVFLWRYSGQADTLVGTPVLGRSDKKFLQQIGYFVNTAVMRGQIEPHNSFREHLRHTNDRVLAALAHADFPFATLVERLQPTREAAHMPLTQVLFNLLRPPRNLKELVIMSLKPTGEQTIDLGAFTASGLDIATGQQSEDFGLNLDILDLEDKLIGDFKYSANLFKEETIVRMAEHFQVLLSNIVASPDSPVAELSLLSAAERQKVLVDWNQTAIALPSDQFIQQLIEQQAAKTPEATAVRFGDQQLTYGELNQRANQLAHHLQAIGIGPEKLVGISLERSLEMIVALIGILKAGGAYLPLDPTYPTERLAYMLTDARPDVLLTQQSLLTQLPVNKLADEPVILCLDSEWAIIAQQSKHNPLNQLNADNLAYVIYTSGSTGQPKGVMIPHRAVLNHNLAVVKQFQLCPQDRVWQFATINFDAAVEEIFPTLMSGATLLLREKDVPPTDRLVQLIAEAQLTVLNLPTAYWAEWVGALAKTSEPIPDCLRLVIVGGEKTSSKHYCQWRELAGANKITWLNTYGPTETTIISTLYQADRCLAEIPIGRPLANTQTYILNETQQPVPVGVPGELYIGGAGLARGYLNRPDLTDARFVTVLLDRTELEMGGLRLYRTGDMARYLPDGNIEFLGRADSQVKIRGFRVELGEIEAALRQHSGVRGTAVTLHTETNGGQRLVAYLIPNEDPAPTTAELRQFLQQKLPHFMIPAAFVTLPELPLSPNGKVDRKALPIPAILSPEQVEAYVAPKTQQEKLLANLWGQILQVGQIGIHDNFFELGGHSLLATQIISRIRETIQVDIPVRAIFEWPTIAELAAHIAELQASEANLAPPPLIPVERSGPLPLSFSQERMWFLYQLDPNSTAYNIPGAVRLKGALDTAALEWSLDQIIARHESLRTRFTAVNGHPTAIIDPNYKFSLPIEDCRSLPAYERENQAMNAVKKAARTPFLLDQLPLFHIKLFQLDDDEYILLIIMHHIISDQWSMGVLTRDLAAYYRAYLTNQAAHLPEMTIQASDHAIWQRQLAADGAFADQMTYWKQQLTGLSPLDLPSDRPRPTVKTAHGTILTAPLPPWLMSGLQTLSQQESVSPFMILLAGFKLLLSRYTGVDDIAVGSPIANRHHLQSETLITTLVNTLVLRTDLSGNLTFRQLLQRVQKMALDAYAHQDVPFEKLVEMMQPARDTSRSPLFQVFFNVQNAPFSFPDLPDVHELEPLIIDRGAAQFDLSLSVDMTISHMAALEYNTDLFDAARMERLMGHLWTLLATAVTNPDRHLAELPLLTDAEIAQLDAWNDTAVPFPTDACLHHLFEAQAQQTPQKTAVAFEGKTLTYQQLNQRANQLARHLQFLGVGSGDLVGINLERSLEMVVALFAVHKAGAAYIPLDPGFPQDRLDFMLADSQARVLITQSALLAKQTAETALQFICLDRDTAVIAQYDEQNLTHSATSADLAYVIYTSGSTGKPKGVQIEHRSAVNFLHAMRRQPGLSAEDVLLSVTTLSFDIAALEIFLPLLNGAQIELVSRETAVNAAKLQAALTQSGTTIMQATPTTWRMLLEAGWQGNAQLKILCGGEAMPRDLADQLLPRCGELWNMYGPTETTIWSSVYRVEPGEGLVSIGQPIDNTTFYILDREKRPLPVGIPGELFIGGSGLARGYLNRPELTAEKFIRNPFVANQGAEAQEDAFSRLYRTGDLARFLPDGNVEFFGRIDTQVKVRGYRIELGEIEAVLAAHPALREIVVAAREINSGDKRLVAYFIPETVAPTADELRTFARASLPDYMIPAAFMELESFPLTPNNKIDRQALPAPTTFEQTTTTATAVPQSDLEIQLTRIWERVLGISGIGRHDNFFELGGHSLLAVRVFAQIEQITQMQFPLTLLFRAPTIAKLADVLRSEGWQTKWTSLVPVQPNGSRPIFFHVTPFLISVLSFSELARHLGENQPLYGLQPQGFAGDAPHHERVEEMAAHYIKEIRTIQPEGPYLLGGHCAGSWVAFEMAQQLQAQGEEVSLLVLVDSEPPNIEPPRINPLKYMFNRSAFYFKEGRFWDAFSWQLGLLYQRFVIYRLGEETARRAATVRKAHAQAHRQYRSGKFDGDVVLIRSHESTILRDKDWHLRWSELITGRLYHETVPGTHAGLLIEPSVSEMAVKIQAAIDKTLAREK